MGRATRSDAELVAACRGDRVLAEDVTQDTFVTAWRRETALDDHDVAGGGSPFEQLACAPR